MSGMWSNAQNILYSFHLALLNRISAFTKSFSAKNAENDF
jgi:hypothetical protein